MYKVLRIFRMMKPYWRKLLMVEKEIILETLCIGLF